jgi:hypothetical protein
MKLFLCFSNFSNKLKFLKNDKNSLNFKNKHEIKLINFFYLYDILFCAYFLISQIN